MTLTTEKNSNLSSPWIIKEHFTPKENPSLKKLEKHMPRSFAGQTATLQRGCIIIAVGLISIGIVGLFVSGTLTHNDALFTMARIYRNSVGLQTTEKCIF